MKYEIKGDSLPVVICQLEAGEQMITEGGGMSWMSPNMQRWVACLPARNYSRMFILRREGRE